jgi:hypothetical protein
MPEINIQHISPCTLNKLFFILQHYDREVESNPRRRLAPKRCSQNASRIHVQPPVFDIYLCENCDGEFDSLTEVQVSTVNLCMGGFFLSHGSIFSAYFPKMKVGLSYHQSLCISVCVSPTSNF